MNNMLINTKWLKMRLFADKETHVVNKYMKEY